MDLPTSWPTAEIPGNVGATRVSTHSELILRFHVEELRKEAKEELDRVREGLVRRKEQREEQLKRLREIEQGLQVILRRNCQSCGKCAREFKDLLDELGTLSKEPPSALVGNLEEVVSAIQSSAGSMVEVRALSRTSDSARRAIEVDGWTTGPEGKKPDPDEALKAQAAEITALRETLKKLEGQVSEAQSTLIQDIKGSSNPNVVTTDPAFTDVENAVAAGGLGAKNFVAPSPVPEPPAKLPSIRRGLADFLPRGRIVVQDTGLEPGDEIEVEVDLLEMGTDADGAAGQVLDVDERAQFAVSLRDYGWRTHRRGTLIFHRADTVGPDSPDKPWKGNVAALYEWGYLERYPSDFGEVWNALEPSFGFHVASVDLDPNTGFEVGAGANLSLFDGLLSFGYGYDFMAERYYHFIGGDIFKLIDTLK